MMKLRLKRNWEARFLIGVKYYSFSIIQSSFSTFSILSLRAASFCLETRISPTRGLRAFLSCLHSRTHTELCMVWQRYAVWEDLYCNQQTASPPERDYSTHESSTCFEIRLLRTRGYLLPLTPCPEVNADPECGYHDNDNGEQLLSIFIRTKQKVSPKTF